MTAIIISVCNYKGGAGKSTIAVNLACALQRSLGLPCLLVDADRQGTALRWSDAGKLAVKVVDRVLHEAREDDRYPGMLWITQIQMLAEKHPYIVIDMPRHWQPWTESMILGSNRCFIVAELTVPGLRSARGADGRAGP